MKKVLTAFSLLFLFSCAASYRPISGAFSNYAFEQEEETGMKYSYKYDMLSESQNMKYAKKEGKKGIQLIAIRIENNTGRPLYFGKDIDVYMGKNLVFPMTSDLIYETIKQPAPLYLLWGLLWVIITKCDGYDCTSIPIPVGLGIGIGNMAAASTANKKLYIDLVKHNLFGKEIANGETIEGFIGIPNAQPQPITLFLK